MAGGASEGKPSAIAVAAAGGSEGSPASFPIGEICGIVGQVTRTKIDVPGKGARSATVNLEDVSVAKVTRSVIELEVKGTKEVDAALRVEVEGRDGAKMVGEGRLRICKVADLGEVRAMVGREEQNRLKLSVKEPRSASMTCTDVEVIRVSSGHIQLKVKSAKAGSRTVFVEIEDKEGSKSYGEFRLVVSDFAALGSISGQVGAVVTRTIPMAVKGRRRDVKATITGSSVVSVKGVEWGQGESMVEVGIDGMGGPAEGDFELIVADRSGPLAGGRGRVTVSAEAPPQQSLGPHQTFSGLPSPLHVAVPPAAQGSARSGGNTAELDELVGELSPDLFA
jgi:hypothetical protein